MMVSHAFVLGLTLLFMTGVVAAVNGFLEGASGSISISLSQQLCQQMAAEITSMHHASLRSSSYESFLELDLPEKIAGREFFITAAERKIMLNDGSGKKLAECFAPVDMSGNARGGRVRISMGIFSGISSGD